MELRRLDLTFPSAETRLTTLYVSAILINQVK